jgi:hypothetical protein
VRSGLRANGTVTQEGRERERNTWKREIDTGWKEHRKRVREEGGKKRRK